MGELAPVLLIAAAVCAARLIARRTGVSSPVLLVVGGIAAAAAIRQLRVQLDPHVVLVLVIPPLLYSAALDSSLLDFRANKRPIALLSVGLVMFTSLVVGLVAHALIPGIPISAAFALGAIVGPPDAVAAIAIGRRVGLPARLQTIIEGEGLLNDATALVLYSVAVSAARNAHTFSVWKSAGLIVYAAGAGALVGFLVARIIGYVRSKLDEPLVENALSLATPFLAYIPAEEIHASGVLAVVVAGLILGHASPTVQSSRSRLQTQPVWKLITFLLEGTVFLLIGLQLPEILKGLDAYSVSQLTWYALVLLAVVLVTRPLWIFPAQYLPRRLSRHIREHDPVPPWQYPTALSWAGMRGVVSLAAAFALPADFPQRDLLLFLTFVIICGTLLLQGLTFSRVLRFLGLRRDRQGLLLAQAAAQQSAVRAGLRRLEEVLAEEPPPDGVAEGLRQLATHRMNSGWERLAEVRDLPEEEEPPDETPSAGWRRLRAEMLMAERAELVRLRDSGQLPDEALREMQRQLDFEEVGLRR
jgi:CPA1 family monovalent cation:H+ antiporter